MAAYSMHLVVCATSPSYAQFLYQTQPTCLATISVLLIVLVVIESIVGVCYQSLPLSNYPTHNVSTSIEHILQRAFLSRG